MSCGFKKFNKKYKKEMDKHGFRPWHPFSFYEFLDYNDPLAVRQRKYRDEDMKVIIKNYNNAKTREEADEIWKYSKKRWGYFPVSRVNNPDFPPPTTDEGIEY